MTTYVKNPKQEILFTVIKTQLSLFFKLYSPYFLKNSIFILIIFFFIFSIIHLCTYITRLERKTGRITELDILSAKLLFIS